MLSMVCGAVEDLDTHPLHVPQVLPYATWATTRKHAQPAVAQAGGADGMRHSGRAAVAPRQQGRSGRFKPDRLADALPSAKRRRCGAVCGRCSVHIMMRVVMLSGDQCRAGWMSE